MIGNTIVGSRCSIHNTTTAFFVVDIYNWILMTFSLRKLFGTKISCNCFHGWILCVGEVSGALQDNDLVHYEIMAKWCNGKIEAGDWSIAMGCKP